MPRRQRTTERTNRLTREAAERPPLFCAHGAASVKRARRTGRQREGVVPRGHWAAADAAFECGVRQLVGLRKTGRCARTSPRDRTHRGRSQLFHGFDPGCILGFAKDFQVLSKGPLKGLFKQKGLASANACQAVKGCGTEIEVEATSSRLRWLLRRWPGWP